MSSSSQKFDWFWAPAQSTHCRQRWEMLHCRERFDCQCIWLWRHVLSCTSCIIYSSLCTTHRLYGCKLYYTFSFSLNCLMQPPGGHVQSHSFTDALGGLSRGLWPGASRPLRHILNQWWTVTYAKFICCRASISTPYKNQLSFLGTSFGDALKWYDVA